MAVLQIRAYTTPLGCKKDPSPCSAPANPKVLELTIQSRKLLVPPGGYITVKGANNTIFPTIGFIDSLAYLVAKAVSMVTVP